MAANFERWDFNQPRNVEGAEADGVFASKPQTIDFGFHTLVARASALSLSLTAYSHRAPAVR
jgi:hypothetical protein